MDITVLVILCGAGGLLQAGLTVTKLAEGGFGRRLHALATGAGRCDVTQLYLIVTQYDV